MENKLDRKEPIINHNIRSNLHDHERWLITIRKRNELDSLQIGKFT